ncbi:MAG: hypothetical protein ACI9IP_001805 [Arcticibacterium sp.]|jgi:uncharacterized protein (DUF885 family)
MLKPLYLSLYKSNNMRIIKSGLIVLIAFMLYSCKSEETKQIEATTEITTLYHDFYEEGLILEPFSATWQGDNRYNDKMLNYYSESYKNDNKSYYTKYLDWLSKIDRNALNNEDRVNYDVLKWECEINLEGLEFMVNELLPLDQFNSNITNFAIYGSGNSIQPFKTVKDYEDWLKRVDVFEVMCDTALVKMKKGVELGYVLPKALIEKTIPQLASFANDNIENHTFYGPIKNLPADFSQEDKERLTKAYKDMIASQVIPSYKKLLMYLEGEYLANGRATSGIWDVPKGSEFYQHQIRVFTNSDLTAEEVHEIGLSEVARLRSEMMEVKEEVGYEGDLKSFFDFVRSNRDLMPYTEPAQVIANFEKIYERMKPNLERLFDKVPKTAFEIRRTESFREKSASASYSRGTKDGSRAGVFRVPIPDVKNYNNFRDEDLFLHEAIPGHHYQRSLQIENENLPDFRRGLLYSSTAEGWGLYAESLGKELGLYTDPYQYFGMLGGEIHRAIRLVVDSGIHAKKWTREQAITYSLENEGFSEEKVTSEIERYMAMPGQALSYKMGQLKLIELREKAKNELGDKFDIKQYHNIVLETGSVSLNVLENVVNEWIDSLK